MKKADKKQKSGEQLLLPPVKKHAYFYIVFVSAFLGALLLWLYAIGYDSTIFERKITNVPVTVTGIEQLRANRNFMLAEELDIEITVTVSGRRSVIYGINAADLTASVDVSGVDQAGESSFPITVSVPNGINVAGLSSGSVRLYLDEFITKTVPVNVLYTDYVLPSGLRLGEIEVNPVVAVLEGPAGELANINAAFVQLSLGEVTGSVAAYGPLFLRYENGTPVTNKYVRITTGDAYVFVSVYKEKTVPVVVSFTGGVFTSESASINLSRQTLTISGSIDLIDSINQITIEVDETLFDFGKTATVTRYFGALLPAGVSVESGDALVTAEITVPDITKRFFYIPASRISVIQADGESFVTAESGITVTVVGFRDVLAAMTVDNIITTINAQNIFANEEGRDVAYAAFTFTEDILGVYIFGEYTVNVSIQDLTQQ